MKPGSISRDNEAIAKRRWSRRGRGVHRNRAGTMNTSFSSRACLSTTQAAPVTRARALVSISDAGRGSPNSCRFEELNGSFRGLPPYHSLLSRCLETFSCTKS